MAKDWTSDFIEMLKGQKNRSDMHELIVMLSEKQNKTKEEEKKLGVLLKAERAKDRARKATVEASKMLGEGKKAEREARNHRLILIGLAAEAKLTQQELISVLDGFLTKREDRALFGLEQKP